MRVQTGIKWSESNFHPKKYKWRLRQGRIKSQYKGLLLRSVLWTVVLKREKNSLWRLDWYLAWHSQLGLGVLLLDMKNFTEHQRQKRLLCKYNRLGQKNYFIIISQNKNTNVVQAIKITKHLSNLTNISDCNFFTSYWYSLALFLPPYREDLRYLIIEFSSLPDSTGCRAKLLSWTLLKIPNTTKNSLSPS